MTDPIADYLTRVSPIADYLTRVRNAYLAKHKIVEIPASKMKMEITRILHEKGYILSYKLVEGTPYNTIKIALKYHPTTKQAAVKKIQRVSSPGLRKYVGVEDMPRVLNSPFSLLRRESSPTRKPRT